MEKQTKKQAIKEAVKKCPYKRECDEGFFKTEYFLALKTIQKLREELYDMEKSWKETCDIMCDKETMEGIEKSLQQIREGKTIPLSKLDVMPENQEINSQQPLKTNSNVGTKSYGVEKNELGSMETGDITSSGVEDHLPKSNFSPADTKFANQTRWKNDIPICIER